MDKSDITLERIRTFVRVVERGGLSPVARELAIGQSTVTRHLQELEHAVGLPLLSRTTRKVVPTEEGRRYYSDCLHILRLVERATDDVRRTRNATAGNVRISCTVSFGVLHAASILFAAQDTHPGISLDLSFSDERVDLVREGFDLAIRLGPVEDSGMRLRALGRSHRLLVASPAYLNAAGRPSHVDDLAAHQGIRMANVSGSDLLRLSDASGLVQSSRFGGRLVVDNGLAARQALIAGRGIAPAHLWLVADLVKSGDLEVVLPGFELEPVALSLLIVPERSAIERVRVMIELIASGVRQVPGIR